jgi:hypothetical protein
MLFNIADITAELAMMWRKESLTDVKRSNEPTFVEGHL